MWIAFYLVVFFFLTEYLPVEYFRDSLLIQKLALTSDVSEWGGAFSIAAFIARTLPPPVLKGLIALLGSFTIWYVIQSLKTVKGLVLIVPVLAPFIILNMLDFGKESFVIPLTFLVLWATRKSPTVLFAFIAICLIYLAYGIFFRPYYLIILAAFLACIFFVRIALPFRIIFVSAIIVALFLLPSQLFMDLQGDRDRINYIANLLTAVVHTAIMNPFPPDSAAHFIINYFYAVFRLLVPVATRQAPSDFVLLYNVLFFGYFLWVGVKNRGMGPVGLLPLLYIAHMLVLFIFEPDSGSFLRHASSIMLYLLPTISWVEERRVEKAREAQRAEGDAEALSVGPLSGP
jgi:hypothetical protein